MFFNLDQKLASFWSATRINGAATSLTPDQNDELRALQIRAILSLAPVMMAANLVNVLIIDFLFWKTPHQLFLAAWTLCVFGILAIGAENWRRSKTRPVRTRASPRGARRITLNALLFGAIWAAPIVLMFHDVTEAQRVVLATCAAGMISGGALSLATVWQAALVYSLAIEVPTAIVLIITGDPMYIGLAALSASFGGLMAGAVFERSRLFVASFVTNLNLREQGQVISLLLKEFEESSSDWLFEVDAEGRLARVSNRLAGLLGKPATELEGMAVAALLGESPPGEVLPPESARSTLNRAFRRHLAFRDILLPVTVKGEQRWWSLSAKPILAEDGAFCGYRGVGSDITDAIKAKASIEHMASYDALTGMPNRTLLHLRLTHAIARLNAEGGNFAILTIDLDRFKNVNDTLGHQVGDVLLVEVAKRITAQLRDHDIVARFGGDEFVILQTGLRNANEAGALAKRLVAEIGEPYDLNGQRILIGASVGIALAPHDGQDADELLRNSDLALYRAKADGKGRHCFFETEMDAAMQSRRLLEIDLREAIEEKALEVYFQPLIDIRSGQISTCEALVRWNHPTRGSISPVDFIPLAEETGLITSLGEFVLRKACTEAASWERKLHIAVNLSAIQFRSGDLVATVAAILRETGLPPARLELEVTESILIEEKDEVLKALTSLRALGVRISLDDFGTGYSSLAYLSSFPFDKIKIDRSFVHDVSQRPESAAIIRAIMSLAASLGMCTTAEGVENIAELDWLREQGCGEVQGFLFSAPVPASELKLLLGLKGGPVAKPVLIEHQAA